MTSEPDAASNADSRGCPTVLDLFDREPVGPQNQRKAQPLGHAGRSDFKAIAWLQARDRWR